jgi:hypothetical protein
VLNIDVRWEGVPMGVTVVDPDKALSFAEVEQFSGLL